MNFRFCMLNWVVYSPLEGLAVRHWYDGGCVEMVCEIDMLRVIISVEEVAFSFNGGKDSTVLLHLLRGGYLLQKAGKNMSTGDSGDAEITFPMRTIYFESPSAFHGSFICYMWGTINPMSILSRYNLQMDIIRQDFKSGLEALLKAKPIRAIFLGVRIGDPIAIARSVLP